MTKLSQTLETQPKSPETTTGHIDPVPVFETEKAAKLGTLIVDIIATEPFEFEGFTWAAKHQLEMAIELEISVATLRRLISKPPFVRERTLDEDGKQITLLRIGKPGPKSPRHLANIMAKLYCEKFGKRPNDKAFGCLCGLAEIWPAEEQINIFKTILANWESFLGAAKLVLEMAEDQGLLTFRNLKFDYLPITLLRIDCVAAAAVEFHIAEAQHNKTWKKLSPAAKATMPGIWPT